MAALSPCAKPDTTTQVTYLAHLPPPEAAVSLGDKSPPGPRPAATAAAETARHGHSSGDPHRPSTLARPPQPSGLLAHLLVTTAIATNPSLQPSPSDDGNRRLNDTVACDTRKQSAICHVFRPCRHLHSTRRGLGRLPLLHELQIPFPSQRLSSGTLHTAST